MLLQERLDRLWRHKQQEKEVRMLRIRRIHEKEIRALERKCQIKNERLRNDLCGGRFKLLEKAAKSHSAPGKMPWTTKCPRWIPVEKKNIKKAQKWHIFLSQFTHTLRGRRGRGVDVVEAADALSTTIFWKNTIVWGDSNEKLLKILLGSLISFAGLVKVHNLVTNHMNKGFCLHQLQRRPIKMRYFHQNENYRISAILGLRKKFL